ncbi:MAG: DUF3800 domain-containing protein [Proteobacteria bacterium]|nr:DUF3800 domain-containing protein [Pseudomonadota bacterium]
MNIYPLNGKKIMRHFYLDEAGIGNPKIEPYTVVAGFLLHVDNQYEMLRKYILDMADNLVAPNNERPDNFCFHAKDLWHGSRFFSRDKWPLEKRLEILGYLADIPDKFDLPIIYTCIKREDFVPIDLVGKKRANADSKCHATCFLSCLSHADRWMEEFQPEEKIFAIVELHRDHKSGLEEIANTMSDPRVKDQIIDNEDFHWKPLKYFVESPLFTPKSGNSPLQVADVCAFILSRALAGGNHTAELLEKIRPNLVSGFERDFFRKTSSDYQEF